MKLGIFAKTFARQNVAAIFDAVVAHGLHCVHFNMVCAGLPAMPDEIPDAIAQEIAIAARQRHIEILAISGTFNMIHPDPRERRTGLHRFATLARICGTLPTGLISVCTGTRDPFDMWRAHPDNQTAEAWSDLVETLGEALEIAAQHDLIVGFEPEHGNVINSAQAGRRLLDEMQSERLRVILDGANLIEGINLAQQSHILTDAVALLGDSLILAHAKDRAADGRVVAAGHGVVDYPLFVDLLKQAGFQGALIMHGLSEDEIGRAIAYLHPLLA